MPSHISPIYFSPLLNEMKITQRNVRQLCLCPWFGLTRGIWFAKNLQLLRNNPILSYKRFFLWIMSPSLSLKCCRMLPVLRSNFGVLYFGIFHCWPAMQKFLCWSTKAREKKQSMGHEWNKIGYESAAWTRALTASPPDNAFNLMCHKMMHRWQSPLYSSTLTVLMPTYAQTHT